VRRNLGETAESLRIYRRLAAIDATVAGAPAALVAELALCDLGQDRAGAASLRKELLAGRWRLTRGQFAFYWSEAARIAGAMDEAPAHLTQLAEAVSQIWETRRSDAGPRGQAVIWAGGHPYYVIWRGSPEHRAALLTTPEAILEPIAAAQHAQCVAVDGQGRALAGHKDAASRAAVRTAAEGELPWTLYVTGTPAPAPGGMLASQRFLLLGMATMVLFLIAGTYFIARAIRREMEVSRLQSDFVSAVSHEFRSPLTSMRQLSELLALGRVPSEERRGVYYETLVRETMRLQRLVESLLNFGRMEAGARQYRFEPVDAAALAHRVAAEFEPQIAADGRHIELAGETAGCVIEADPEAISVALRNLVDNALKYSPAEPRVWVEWHSKHGIVGISVRDRGVGIAASERKAIFRKFVRGTAAATGNVKGSGVGLAMVRHIVAAHGGEIQVESELGRGSTFTMLLPALGRV
jgi:signal transduction histidine kinase